MTNEEAIRVLAQSSWLTSDNNRKLYVMKETQGIEATMDFCVCNALKYIYRHRNKNGVEDIKKADWYLKKYIELQEEKGE